MVVMPRKDIWKDGINTQFSASNPPQNPGRRPSVFAKYIKENRVSLDDIRALISSLLCYDPDEIQKMISDKKNKPPVALILMLKAIKSDMDKGVIDNLERLTDRAYGKPEKMITHGIREISPETLAKLDYMFGGKPKQESNEKKPNAAKGAKTAGAK